MAVQSFNKPVRLWDSDDAPVKGQRFDDYLHIAKTDAKDIARTGKLPKTLRRQVFMPAGVFFVPNFALLKGEK